MHYALLLCLLLIQLLIAGFFYNEFVSRKKINTLEQKLNEIHAFEDLTNASKNQLISAQENLQKYLQTKDRSHLKDYFSALNIIGKNLETLDRDGAKYPQLNAAVQKNPDEKKLTVNTFRKMIDSASESTTRLYPQKNTFKIPQANKFDGGDFNFSKYDIDTKTYSDTIKKKGLFGRLGDALKGKETVRKETTVTTIKQGEAANSVKLKKTFDSLADAANRHYSKEIQKITVQVHQQEVRNEKEMEFPTVFGDLLVYNNGLMKVYEDAVSNAKSDLQKEYAAQNSKNNKIRVNLVLAAMGLMFLVSVLIAFLTRQAFIYERKLNSANEQISQNLNFKNRILGMLSHELRSPLKMMDIFIKRISKKTEDENVKEYLKSMSFTNSSLLIQANQILEYTKNQQAANQLSSVVFNLKNEIKSIGKAIEPYIEARNNRFDFNLNIAPAIVVETDNAKIHQLYLNILGNANKFTENGTIRVAATAQPLENGFVAFSTEISDSGTGISEADLAKIFEPYYQGVLSNDVENLGAGLGLSLCKEIVELYGGTISVESKKGVGTTVKFLINLKQKKNDRFGKQHQNFTGR